VRLWARGDLRIPAAEASEPEPEPEQHLNKAFAAFGLAPEAPVILEEDFFLWPENVTAFNLWMSVQSQWKWASRPVGMGGAIPFRTGLDYPGVDICLRHLEASKKEKRWYFGAVQAMERAALDEWNKER
jgi:hypothetical protein